MAPTDYIAAVGAGAPSSPWMRLAEAAVYGRVSVGTLRNEIRRGRLRHARVGGRRAIRVRREWIDLWLETTATPREEAPQR
jgi:excisionase family DNA binding protein